MNELENSNNSSAARINPTTILEVIEDPIRLSIVIEIIRKPGTAIIQIKKKLGLEGSKIYYYINQLLDKQVIEETETERVTEHLSRRKFTVSKWFKDSFMDFRHETGRHHKAVHLAQLHFAVAVLNQQIRTLERIPENEFDHYIDSQALPHRQIYFLDEEGLPFAKKGIAETTTQIRSAQQKYDDELQLLEKAAHVAILGVYPMD
ncbi:MAG: hypothetical protein ACFFB3_01335 [Candidatus Hodarchaeota archaeon]